MKIFFITLGCKVNQYESQAMMNMLSNNGFTQTEEIQNADIIIVNSCTVTSTSDQKVRKTINRAKRNNPNAIIVLTGCMTQANPKISENFLDVDIILGNSNRSLIVPSIINFINTKERIVDIRLYNKNDKFENINIDSFEGRTRAFIKIEDGCNRFCSYCIIPFARGPIRSKSIAEIITEATHLAQAGYKEIVLVGINLSLYGQDINMDLCDAIEAVCSIDKIERVRLGSLEPEKLSLDVIQRIKKQKKLCPQFHLSLQSGCDATLKRMNRHYNTQEYLEIVENLRSNFHNASITTDIMVGFPGETGEEFEISMEFAKKVHFAKMHVFSYSIRPGTKAAIQPNQISNKLKSERNQKMGLLEFEMRKQFLESQIGKTVDVLIESNINGEYQFGYTNNYTPIIIKHKDSLYNNMIKVKIMNLKIIQNNNTENSLFCEGQII